MNNQKKERSKLKGEQIPPAPPAQATLLAALLKKEREAYVNKLAELATLEAAVDKINSLIK